MRFIVYNVYHTTLNSRGYYILFIIVYNTLLNITYTYCFILYYSYTYTQGFHEFSEFVAEDVGTLDSGLNSVVLANNNEFILLPLNEPTFGTPRKSQIQTYLEQNQVGVCILLLYIIVNMLNGILFVH